MLLRRKKSEARTVEQPELLKGSEYGSEYILPEKIYNPIPDRRPLRAIVEIIDGELNIVPVADSDADEQLIWDALRSVCEECQQ